MYFQRHRTFLFKVGSHRGRKHIVFPLTEPHPQEGETQAQTHAPEPFAEGAAQLGKVSAHPDLPPGALQAARLTSGGGALAE